MSSVTDMFESLNKNGINHKTDGCSLKSRLINWFYSSFSITFFSSSFMLLIIIIIINFDGFVFLIVNVMHSFQVIRICKRMLNSLPEWHCQFMLSCQCKRRMQSSKNFFLLLLLILLLWVDKLRELAYNLNLSLSLSLFLVTFGCLIIESSQVLSLSSSPSSSSLSL